MIQQEIEEARKKLQNLENQQKNCHHEWDATKYDAEPYKKEEVIIGDFSQCHGSDYHPSTRFVDATKDRWSRTCKQCGVTEYTYEKAVVKVETEPKFR